MFFTILIAICLTLLNIQNCTKIEKKIDSFSSNQVNNDSLQDRNLKLATENLNILHLKKYRKKRCSYICHDVNRKNVTITRKIPKDSFLFLLYSAPIKNKKRFCNLIWKCQM